MTTPTSPDAEPSLTLALADAMQHARVEMDAVSLRPTSLTVALMAEHMIQHGWPATRPPWRVVTTEGGELQ